MPADFLHGVETIDLSAGPRPIRQVKSAVIGLVGVAPSGPVNTPTLILSDRDNAQFGASVAGVYTIADALKAIQDQGAGTVIVVNVFDPLNAGGKTIAQMVAADIVGGVGADGKRTGIEALRDAASMFGFGPKLLIVPGFSSQAAVAVALKTVAQKTALRAMALCDAPLGATRDEVIAARGTADTIDLTASDNRLVWSFPGVKVYDKAADATVVHPYSPRLAGAIAATDADVGYWKSPSNRQIQGVTGIELPLSASVNDAQSDVNALNAAGIVTIFTGYGAGIRTWGNRSSAFPTSSDIKTFIPVQRTIDVVDESIELAALEFLDGPIGDVLITAILDSVNAFLRTLIGRGALMPGSRVEYFAEDNPPDQLALGKLTFTKTFCPPPPAERITYKSVVDTTLLKVA